MTKKPFERSTRRSLFWFEPSTCDSHLERAEHRDIRRPQLAWLVSERSLHHERLDPLASWPDAPCPSSSLYHKRLDPLASWPTPSPSLSLFRFFISAGESLVFVVFFRGMAVLRCLCSWPKIYASVSFLSLLRKSGNLRKSISGFEMEILETETQSV